MTQLARLTAAESRAFNKHEATIERGLETFLEVGHALADIRDRRLYRQTHSSFESYCNERWGRGRRWANQLICASVAATNAGNHGSLRPNARHARALAKAPAECQAEVWPEMVDQHGEKVTAAKVTQAVKRITAESEPTLSFGSLCSGIEGAAVALPGWRHAFCAETDPITILRPLRGVSTYPPRQYQHLVQ